jgi:hypothetical protein
MTYLDYRWRFFRRAMAIHPKAPEPNSQTAAGIGTAAGVPVTVMIYFSV